MKNQKNYLFYGVLGCCLAILGLGIFMTVRETRSELIAPIAEKQYSSYPVQRYSQIYNRTLSLSFFATLALCVLVIGLYFQVKGLIRPREELLRDLEREIRKLRKSLLPYDGNAPSDLKLSVDPTLQKLENMLLLLKSETRV